MHFEFSYSVSIWKCNNLCFYFRNFVIHTYIWVTSAFLFRYTLITAIERTERLLTCFHLVWLIFRGKLSNMHAFSVNDYIPSFIRKGKQLIWKFFLKHQEFLQTFANFGLFSNITEQTRNQLERFLCLLYGGKSCFNINELSKIIRHWSIFKIYKTCWIKTFNLFI